MGTVIIPTVGVWVAEPTHKKNKPRNQTWTRFVAREKMPSIRPIVDGLFQIHFRIRRDDSVSEVTLTDRSLRGDLFHTLDLALARIEKEHEGEISNLLVRWWVLPEARLTRQLQIVRKHEREKDIPCGEWSEMFQLFAPQPDGSWKYPPTSAFPRRLYGVYRVYFRWRNGFVLLYTGLSADCVRKRLLRHFEARDPYDEYGWFCPAGSPHIFVQFMRLHLDDLEEAEHILIQQEQPPMNRDRKERPYQRRLFGRYTECAQGDEEIPF